MSQPSRTLAVCAALALAVSAPACTAAAEDDAGHLAIWLGFGRWDHVIGDISGEVRLATERSEEVIPFTAEADAEGTVVVSTEQRADLAYERDCDPADGPVAMTVTLLDFASDAWPPSGLRVPLDVTETRTLPCRAGWLEIADLRLAVEDPRLHGALTVRVVLDTPPEGAVAADVLVSAGTWSFPSPVELLPLTPEGDVLAGETAVPCMTDRPDVRLEQSIVSLTVPGMSQDDVWALWPPPVPDEVTQRCVAGETIPVEIHLTPRPR